MIYCTQLDFQRSCYELNEQNLEIRGRRCHVYGADGADSCIICGMENHIPDEIKDTAGLLYESDEAKNCRLIIFETTDWNGDFSPWPAQAAFGDEPFTGKAPETLSWIMGSLIPHLTQENIIPVDCKKYIAGYSLSGLFALWAFLESDAFDGAANCSGSLWLPGWMEYMRSRKRSRDCIVYLSLGSKEEKTKNALMSAVGDNTRESYSLLKRDAHVTKATLEWNKGGHFANPTERLAKGMLWLLKYGK